jgi:hypothetical protein
MNHEEKKAMAKRYTDALAAATAAMGPADADMLQLALLNVYVANYVGTLVINGLCPGDENSIRRRRIAVTDQVTKALVQDVNRFRHN